MNKPIEPSMFDQAKDMAVNAYDISSKLFDFFILGNGVDTPTQIAFILVIMMVVTNVIHYGSEAYVREKARIDQEGEV